MRLTDRQIREAKPKEKAYKLSDGDGLYLLVKPNGRKYWRFKYRFLNKEKGIAFGVYPEVSLADARERRFEARKLKYKEVDPSEHRKEQRRIAIQKDRDTFEHIAREWHENQCRQKSPYYAKQILQRLENDVFPRIGHRPISKLTAKELLEMARKVEDRGAYELAHRAVQICGKIFQYAIVTERADRNPATDLRGFLKVPQTEHHAHLEEKDLPEFLKTLEAYQGSDQTKRALKLMLLTFVRTNELRQARWDEISFEKKEWRIPATRMKMKTMHIVPLSAQALNVLQILRRLTGNYDWVFPSVQGHHKPISNNTMLYALYGMGYKDKATVHGLRATASTILNESGLFERDVIERQLAHQERNRVRAAYDHSEHLPARRKMMEWWGNKLEDMGLHSNAL
ncbi:MAG: tyrosine-type recombinase/integrase [Alphaproteobacteria bacterium]|nr:tyrosine-type recombinase/integrase [Alphaproteobacteria bacterium]